MAAYDAYRQDLPPGLSTGVTQAQIDRAKAEWATQRAYDDQFKLYATMIVGVIIVLAIVAAFTHRRKIASAADAALISGAAAGVRTARRAQSKRRAWQDRVLAKADEPTPPTS